MPDPYASISEKDESLQTMLADVLELRAADERQQEMLSSFLHTLKLKKNSDALEIGCGTGPISRALLELDDISSVTGIDPSPVFISYANKLSEGLSNIKFETGDARNLNIPDESFDLAVFYTTLCHVPSPENAIAEACRVLRPGGTLAIFDGDYTTATVATSEFDPLQVAVDIMVRNFVENIWMVRQLPKVLRSFGLSVEAFGSNGYTKVTDPSYFLTVIDRGTDLLVNSGSIGEQQSEFIRAEAKRRIEKGEFFGHISYVNAIAVKPD